MAFGRFNGGQHFKYLNKKNIDTKRSVSERATKDQLQTLKKAGLHFQENAISKEKAQQILDKLRPVAE